MNPFDDDNEYGGFGSSTTNKNNVSYGSNNNTPGPNFIQTQIVDSQSRIKSSQQRALASIFDSERIGVDSAQELVEQGEKLNKAEDKLHAIGELQKESQKKINTLSSVFGGFKNMFSRRASEQPVNTSNGSNNLKHTINQGNKNSVEVMQFNDQLQKDTMNSSSSHNDEFDRNISLMNDGMSRLKNLAQSMNQELASQNSQLDRMAPQIGRINDTMTNQSRQMNKLLGVKPK